MPRKLEIKTVFKGIDRFTRPVKRMQTRVGRFTKAAERGLRRVKRITDKVGRALAKGLVIGAGAAAGAFWAFKRVLDSTTERIDELAKRSKRLDFPIEELQQWDFVATQAGMSSEEFSKSIDVFAKNMGDLKMGTGELTTRLKSVDRQFLRQLKGTKDVGEAFDLYVNKLRDIKDPFKRASLAQAAFGRSGKKMINVAKMSQEQVDALKKEMLSNGVVTAEQAKQSEAYNDAMDSLTRSVQGFLADVLTPLLPKIEKWLRHLRDLILANKDIVKSKILEWGEKVVKNWDEIVSTAKKLGIAVGIIMGIVGAVKALTAALTLVNLVMAANPVVLTVMGIVAAVAFATAAIIMNWDDIKWFFQELWRIIGRWAEDFWSDMQFLGATAANFFKDTWWSVKQFFGAVWDGIRYIFEDSMGWIILGPLGWLIKATVEIAKNWDKLKAFFINLWDSIVGVFEAGADRVKKIVSSITDGVTKIAAGAKSLFGMGDNEVNLKVERTLKVVEPPGTVQTQQQAPKAPEVNMSVDVSAPEIGSPIFKVIQGGKEEPAFFEREGGRSEFTKEVVQPTQRVMELVREQELKETSKAEVTIRDETGRAEVTQGRLGSGLKLEKTGSF